MLLPALLAILSLGPATAASDESAANFTAVQMKLLVLSSDGNEPSLQAMTHLLDRLGTPYEVVKLAERAFPVLEAGGVGLYQGIVLATGGLGVCDPTCRSLLPWENWVKMGDYMEKYGVRMLSYYTWPEPKWGMVPTGGQYSPRSNPAQAQFTAAAAAVFPNLKRTVPVPITEAYLYKAQPYAGAGETSTPILTLGDDALGMLHTKNDGKREYLALTFDNNWFLTQSQVLHYGLIQWLTKGVFLGARRAYLTAQSDDLFLPNDLFHKDIAACRPVGFAAAPAFDPTPFCDTWRASGNDLNAIYNWQRRKRRTRQFRDFKVTLAFNAYGATPDAGTLANDSLVQAAKERAGDFIWISHTYDHESLDCYQPDTNNNLCRPANSVESTFEITENFKVADSLNLQMDRQGMVTPSISGLNNADFLRAAATQGIRYLTGDLSRPEGLPSQPNTPIQSPYESSIIYLPRHATSVYYNVTTPRMGVFGSLVDEYNFFYGPNGYFKLPGGVPFFNQDQTYAQIIGRESDALVSYMLQYEMYPVMFHQSNHYPYSPGRSLFTDLLDSAMAKFSQITDAPVISTTQSELGELLLERKAFLDSGVQAFLRSDRKIEISVGKSATIPITGICVEGCESYGSERQSFVPVQGGAGQKVLSY